MHSTVLVTSLNKVCLMLLRLQYAIHLKFIGAPNVGYSTVNSSKHWHKISAIKKIKQFLHSIGQTKWKFYKKASITVTLIEDFKVNKKIVCNTVN